MPKSVVYGDVEEVAVDLMRELTFEEKAKVYQLLARGSALVRHRVPQLPARLAAELVTPDEVASVVNAMAARVMRNPHGREQENLGGGYTYSRSDSASGELFISPDEIAQLDPTAAAGIQDGAFTLALGYYGSNS